MSRSGDFKSRGVGVRRAAPGASTKQVRSPAPGGTPGLPVEDPLDFDPDDIDPEELHEFMEGGDWVDVKADPTFREQLRTRLWEMLRARHGGDGERSED